MAVIVVVVDLVAVSDGLEEREIEGDFEEDVEPVLETVAETDEVEVGDAGGVFDDEADAIEEKVPFSLLVDVMDDVPVLEAEVDDVGETEGAADLDTEGDLLVDALAVDVFEAKGD